jgi:hypothetical protein
MPIATREDLMPRARKGSKGAPYHDWTKQGLVERAKQIGIKGRSRMSKAELIKALRDH